MSILISQIAIVNILLWLLFAIFHPKIKLPKIIDFCLILGACACIGLLATAHATAADTAFKATISVLASISIYRQWKRSTGRGGA